MEAKSRELEPLNVKERARLTELEAELGDIVQSFYRVGEILEEVQTRMLYKEDYFIFEDWCKERFGISKSHSYRLIKGFEARRNLIHAGCKELPETQAAVSQLTDMNCEDQVKVWNKAVEIHKEKEKSPDKCVRDKSHVTGVEVKEASEELFPLELVDGTGAKVPAHLMGAAEDSIFTDALVGLFEFERRIRTQGGHIGGWIDSEKAEKLTKLLIGLCTNATFFAVCPDCGGETCKSCRGLGWMPEHKYLELKENV